MRMRNKERMTVIEQLQKIKDEVCSDYCKYSDAVRLPKYLQGEYAKMRDEMCAKCPMQELRINFRELRRQQEEKNAGNDDR